VRSLTLKLTLAFLLVSLLGIALVAAIIWGFTYIQFNRFLTASGLNEYTATVTSYYAAHGSWEGVTDALLEEGLLPTPPSATLQPGRLIDPPDLASPPHPFVLVDQNGRVITATGPFHAGDQLSIAQFQENVAIKGNNQVVGYVLVTGGPNHLNPIEERYINQTKLAMVYATLGAVLIAVLLGFFLARTITRPIKELTAATGAMARGQLDQKVAVRSRDELGELTSTFNTMSADLEQARCQRQQMTADIAHDLRTPLSVITGYLEGMKDGVLKPTPARFEAMYAEALYLQRLVEDLRTLSLADAGKLSLNCQPVQPGQVIERLGAAFQHQVEQKQLVLRQSVENGLPLIQVDPERMQQVLGNLVSNALRYTPTGGEIALSARREANTILLEVEDTGAGIPAQALGHVFDRFYRGDDSRQEGGSGLGLAIAKSMVELQGGAINAFSAGPGTGSRFTIQFPCPPI
jgi:signal transduction histidine kinase